jgi:hypothetical protein
MNCRSDLLVANHRIRDQEVAPTPAGECVLCAIAGALLAALAVAILVKFMLFAPPKFTALPLDETCSLSSGTCAVQLPDGGRLEFALGPRPVPLLKPLNLELRVAGSSARAVEVDFSGVNLPMAFNRANLSAGGAGRYDGQTSLPLCSSGRMTWNATVLLEDGKRRIYVPFRFETERGNP